MRDSPSRLNAPLTIVLRFVERLNAHDVAGLCGLMTGDHRFIDSLGATVNGRETMRRHWADYFAMVPDYHLRVSHRFSNDSEIVLLGEAGGSLVKDGVWQLESAWRRPVALRASVRGGLVAEWQVYADNEPIRRMSRG